MWRQQQQKQQQHRHPLLLLMLVWSYLSSIVVSFSITSLQSRILIRRGPLIVSRAATFVASRELEQQQDDEYDENDDLSFSSSSLSSSSSSSLQPLRPRPLGKNKKEPLIAIVGRPNVGKSALVNRLAGVSPHRGGSIVADEPGITRDRTYRPAEFLGEAFQVIDTGGLVFDEQTLFAKEIRDQAMIAIQESAAVIFVVDGQSGRTNLDQAIADFLRKEVIRNIPVHVAVNKCESEKTGALAAAEFWNLGLGEPLAVSALHGVGTAELLEQVFASIAQRQTAALPGFGTKVPELLAAKAAMQSKVPLPGEDALDFKLRKKYGIGDAYQKVLERYEAAKEAFDQDDSNTPEEINIAIIGRPNVGKSSLLNAIFGESRAIVSDVAGTTRDSIDAIMERPRPDHANNNNNNSENNPSNNNYNNNNNLPTRYRFVDTAGIRRKGKVEFGPEFFMVNRAMRAMRRADVVLLVLDATAGVTEQDRVLAQSVAEDGRACVIICNKWDAVVDKDSNTYDKSVTYVRNELPQVSWAPIVFLSAATGQRVGKIYDLVDQAVQAHRHRVSTSLFNQVLRDAILWQGPPMRRSGAQAKIYYGHQVSTRPPTMVLYCNDPQLISDNYRRYLDRKVRENLHGFDATPIRWILRGRREREVLRDQQRTMNGAPGDGGSGTSFPFPHAK